MEDWRGGGDLQRVSPWTGGEIEERPHPGYPCIHHLDHHQFSKRVVQTVLPHLKNLKKA